MKLNLGYTEMYFIEPQLSVEFLNYNIIHSREKVKLPCLIALFIIFLAL